MPILGEIRSEVVYFDDFDVMIILCLMNCIQPTYRAQTSTILKYEYSFIIPASGWDLIHFAHLQTDKMPLPVQRVLY